MIYEDRIRCKRTRPNGYVVCYLLPAHPWFDYAYQPARAKGTGGGPASPYLLEHQLVVMAFLGPEYLIDPTSGRRIQVHHMNEDKSDNAPENLRPVTPAQHSAIRRLQKDGLTEAEAAARIGVPSLLELAADYNLALSC